mgnify:CR=1 FL=1
MYASVITVLEVAIGDYGITVDKLAGAVETMTMDDKSVTYAMKPQLEGSCNIFLYSFPFFLHSHIDIHKISRT